MPRIVYLLVCILSGAAALVYEVAWARLFALSVGASAPAQASVIAAVLGGLAVGAFLGGRWAGRCRRPLRVYIGLELGTAVLALFVPVGLDLAEPVYGVLWRAFPDGSLLHAILRFGINALLLFPPTLCIGATIPLLVDALVRGAPDVGEGIGFLYAAGAAGGALGALGSDYLLLPALGLTRTLFFAAGLNGLAALSAWRWGPGEASEPAEEVEDQEEPGEETGVPASAGFVLFAVGLNGLASLIVQIVWLRVAALYFGASVYSFSLVVAASICGLSLGSFLLGRRSGPAPIVFYTLLSGVLVSITFVALSLLPGFVEWMVWKADLGFWGIQALEGGFLFLALLPTSLLFGALLPLIAATLARRFRLDAGRALGTCLLVSGMGNVFGSVGAGFLFIPVFGMAVTIGLAAGALFCAALLLLPVDGRAPSHRMGLAALGGVLLVGIVGSTLGWDRTAAVSAPYLYRPTKQAEKPALLYYAEDSHATVAVEENVARGSLSLSINGKVDASTGDRDMATQLMLAHVPALFHPDPERALVIGLGSGITPGALRGYPDLQTRTVEISRAVIEASTWFAPFGGGPVGEVLCTDARSLLTHDRTEYDLIISEPSNPWLAGIAALFTREAFQLARNRLTEGGIFCQWFHMYGMGVEQVRSIVRTFREVFPDCVLLEVNPGVDYLLLGSRSRLVFDGAAFMRRTSRPAIRRDLDRIGFRDPAEFVGAVVLTPGGCRLFSRGGQVHTDDDLALQYEGPRTLRRQTVRACLEALDRFRGPPTTLLGGTDRTRGRLLPRLREVTRGRKVVARAMAEADRTGRLPTDLARRILAIDPRNPDATRAYADHRCAEGIYLRQKGRPEEAMDAIRAARRLGPAHGTAGREQARLLRERGDPGAALKVLKELVRFHPRDTRTWTLLAEVATEAGDEDQAAEAENRIETLERQRSRSR